MKYIFLIVIAFNGVANASNENNCRLKISKSIYVKDKRTDKPKYVRPFLETFDLLPLKAQKFMCKFSYFNLVDTEASAWANMEFRKGIFDAGIDSSHWNTWKDQLNFGVKNNNLFVLSNELPAFTTTEGVSFLYWIILHEIGHNVVSDSEQWSKFYDEDIKNFKESDRLCFYWCTETIPVAEAPLIYKEVFELTNFLSLYSTRNDIEYWAESFMYYVAIELTGLESKITMPDGLTYKLRDRLLNSGFAKRRASIIKAYDSLEDIEPKSKTFNLRLFQHSY